MIHRIQKLTLMLLTYQSHWQCLYNVLGCSSVSPSSGVMVVQHPSSASDGIQTTLIWNHRLYDNWTNRLWCHPQVFCFCTTQVHVGASWFMVPLLQNLQPVSKIMVPAWTLTCLYSLVWAAVGWERNLVGHLMSLAVLLLICTDWSLCQWRLD